MPHPRSSKASVRRQCRRRPRGATAGAAPRCDVLPRKPADQREMSRQTNPVQVILLDYETASGGADLCRFFAPLQRGADPSPESLDIEEVDKIAILAVGHRLLDRRRSRPYDDAPGGHRLEQ